MKPKTYKKKITRFHALKILEWCKSKFGRGKQNYPSLQFRKPDYLNNPYAMGEYDYEDNFIFVNSQSHNDLLELANTIIHEYTHYRFHSKKEFYKYQNIADYENNPMEIEADSISELHQKNCISELKKQFHQFV